MPAITTHILDTATGRPAAKVPVNLEVLRDRIWVLVAQGTSNEDGRLRVLENATPAVYRLTFKLAADDFYPEIAIQFTVRDDRHHHIPLLLSPFGYSTYRGS
jgi:5-hydroxyisourate hydrolase